MSMGVATYLAVGKVAKRLRKVEAILKTLVEQGAGMDANLQKVLDDLDVIKQEAGDYIAGRDAIDATLNATIKDLSDKLAAAQAQGTADAATIADFQSGVADALAKAEEDKALLAPPTGVVVPDTGGDTSGSSTPA